MSVEGLKGRQMPDVRGWLSRIWHGDARKRLLAAPREPLSSNDPIAELTALIKSGETSQKSLERMATLLAQTDAKRFWE
jgi:hypothetical protein